MGGYIVSNSSIHKVNFTILITYRVSFIVSNINKKTKQIILKQKKKNLDLYSIGYYNSHQISDVYTSFT